MTFSILFFIFLISREQEIGAFLLWLDQLGDLEVCGAAFDRFVQGRGREVRRQVPEWGAAKPGFSFEPQV